METEQCDVKTNYNLLNENNKIFQRNYPTHLTDDLSEIKKQKTTTTQSRTQNILYKIKQSFKLRTIKNKYLVAKYKIKSKLRGLFRKVREIFAFRRTVDDVKQ